MFDSQHRRSALRNAAAAAVIAVPGLTGRGEARARGKKPQRPIQTFRGELENPTYTPIGGADSGRYLIEAGDASGKMRDCERHDAQHMSASRLFRYLERKSGGNFTGKQTFTLGGVNWRLEGVERNPEDGHWRIRARICDSNPGARPRSGQPGAAGRETTAGCNCGCNSYCYTCGSGYRCGSNYQDACLAR